jgi:hypothetical protein
MDNEVDGLLNYSINNFLAEIIDKIDVEPNYNIVNY